MSLSYNHPNWAVNVRPILVRNRNPNVIYNYRWRWWFSRMALGLLWNHYVDSIYNEVKILLTLILPCSSEHESNIIIKWKVSFKSKDVVSSLLDFIKVLYILRLNESKSLLFICKHVFIQRAVSKGLIISKGLQNIINHSWISIQTTSKRRKPIVA